MQIAKFLNYVTVEVFKFLRFWKYANINEVLLILSYFYLLYLFIYNYLKVIFLRDVTASTTHRTSLELSHRRVTLAWTRSHFAQESNLSPKLRVKPTSEHSSNSRLGERLSLERDTLSLKKWNPRLSGIPKPIHPTLSCSRLGETHSPKRDDLSPNLKTLCLSDSLEQKRGMSPCISHLGEPGSLERDMQTLALFHAHKQQQHTQIHTPINAKQSRTMHQTCTHNSDPKYYPKFKFKA